MKDAQLISLEHADKDEDLLEFVSGITKRRRAKYWTGGNDIYKEGKWEWEGTSNLVPDYGWSGEPYNFMVCIIWV